MSLNLVFIEIIKIYIVPKSPLIVVILSHCLICDASVHRLLNIYETGSYCICEIGYIDVLFNLIIRF